MFANGGQVHGSINRRYIFRSVPQLLDNVNDWNRVMILMLFELTDAAKRNLFGALGVETETRERFLCVGVDGAVWVFEDERIHKRIIFMLCIQNINITSMNQKKQGTDDRQKIKAAKNKLNEMVYDAKKRILQGNLTEAHDQLYKFITEQKQKLGGDDSVLIIPGLLTLAEIHIIEGRIKKAEEYLNAAHWSFLKSNDRNVAEKKKEKGQVLTVEQQLDYKINLHRTFAKLYELKSDFKEAINELKTSIYLQSTKWGPQHPYVAHNYFLMGKVFADMGNQSVGESFFSKVAQIWYRYLKNFFEKLPEEQEAFLVEQFSLEEAINYLIYIEKHFEQAYDEDQGSLVFTPVMRIYYSIGLLYKIFGDDGQCQAYLKEVYRRCLKHLPEHDRKTAQVKTLLQSMNVNIDGTPEPLKHAREEDREGYSLEQLGQDD